MYETYRRLETPPTGPSIAGRDEPGPYTGSCCTIPLSRKRAMEQVARLSATGPLTN